MESRKYSAIGFLILACVFAICIIVQTFLAGLAIFTNLSYWSQHSTFVIWFQFIPVLMLISSFISKFPKVIYYQVIILFLLIVPIQYVTAHIPNIGALHPVIALALIWLIFSIIKKVNTIRDGILPNEK